MVTHTAAVADEVLADFTSLVEIALSDERALLEHRHHLLLTSLREGLEQRDPSTCSRYIENTLLAPCGSDDNMILRDAALEVQVGGGHEPKIHSETPLATNKNSTSEAKRKSRMSICLDDLPFRSDTKLGAAFVQKEAETLWILFQPTRLVKSARFELFYGVVILLNCAALAFETQYHGQDAGYQIGYRKFDSTAKQLYPDAESVFRAMEFLFGSLFLLELIIKMLGLRKKFLRQMWNWFDTALCVFWILDTSLQNMPADGSVLRLLRLARLLRLVRLARTVQGFDALYVMTTALQGSMSALVWVAVLLFVVQMMFALFLSQSLVAFVQDESNDYADRKLIFEYFGTFSRSMLTMFELTLGNWVPVARILQEHVSGFFVIFSISHKVSLGFACIGVVNGVFMQETFKVSQSDDALLMRQSQFKKQLHRKKMEEFMEHSDLSGDGKLSKSEWSACLRSEHVHHWFSGQGLSMREAERLFMHLDSDGEGKISTDELVAGVSRLQGTAKSLDLAYFKEDITQELRDVLDGIVLRIGELESNMVIFAKQHEYVGSKKQPQWEIRLGEVNEGQTSPTERERGGSMDLPAVTGLSQKMPEESDLVI